VNLPGTAKVCFVFEAVIGREHHERQFWAGNRLGQKGWIAVIRSKRANYGWLAKSRPPENVILQKS
jgi:hypothetical protein